MRSNRFIWLAGLMVFVVAGCGSTASAPPVTEHPSAVARPNATLATPAGSGAASTAVPPSAAIAIQGVPLPAIVMPGDDAIWAASATQITRLDPESNRATPIVTGLPAGHHVSLGVAGSIWTVHDEMGTASEYDAVTGAELTTFPVGRSPLEPLVAFGSVWVPNHHDGTLSRIDPIAKSVAATITIGVAGPGGPFSLAAGGGLLWASAGNGGPVVGIDPATNRVVKETPMCADGVGYAFDRLWLWECNEVRLQVRDPATLRLLGSIDATTLSLPVAAKGRVWLPLLDSRPGTTTLVGVDPESLAITAEFVAPGEAEGFTAGFDSFWFAGLKGSEVIRVPFSALTPG